jgi:hypothetical protein
MAGEIPGEIKVAIVTEFKALVGEVEGRPAVLLTLYGKDAVGADAVIATVALDPENTTLMVEALKDAVFKVRFGDIEALFEAESR